MKKLTILLSSIALLGLGACGDDGDDGGTPDAAVNPDAPVGPPDMPALSATQIDRMGRPAISTALQETFNGDAAAQGAAKDAYNANASPAAWADYAPGFMTSLAILDSLDTDCGNQLGADLAAPRYSALGGLLAGDMLHVNSGSGTCGDVYLAVEANALGIIPNDDCGGRTLASDVIDVSYSVLAIGAIAGVGDGVAANDVAFEAEFPYLAPAHP